LKKGMRPSNRNIGTRYPHNTVRLRPPQSRDPASGSTSQSARAVRAAAQHTGRWLHPRSRGLDGPVLFRFGRRAEVPRAGSRFAWKAVGASLDETRGACHPREHGK
jgi:hypothetical protein